MWDERAPIHVRSEFYDLDGLRVGQDALRGFEIDEVADVSGTGGGTGTVFRLPDERSRVPLLYSLRAVRD